MTSDEHETPAQRRQRQIAERLKASSPEPTGYEATEPAAPAPAPESVGEPADEPPVDEPPVDETAAARRERMLSGFDPDVAALFTDADLAKIESEERQRVAADRKKLALADIRQRVRLEEQVATGLVPASVLRDEAEEARLTETVRIRINLPGAGAGHRGQNGFRVNGRLYQQGMTYDVPRAVYDSLLEMHFRAHFNEIRVATMNQQLPGNSALEIAGRVMPRLEVAA